MDTHGVKRLVAMSTHGVNESNVGSEYTKYLWSRMGERLRDKETMEPLIRASDVDWTIVRAPRISIESSTGPYQVGENIEITLESHISRAELARFVLDEIVSPAHVGRALSIRE
jgi:putative NADH-flavin reductase